MVMANYMTINEIHPDNIYKWMYEFSLDSYDWVMIFNSYSMGSWSDKGHAMRKPYISSSNYVLRMSSAKKGEWTTVWDDKFKSFIQKNKQIIKHTQLANLVK
jgi:deoxyribodipyrimidine photolyase-related protein